MTSHRRHYDIIATLCACWVRINRIALYAYWYIAYNIYFRSSNSSNGTTLTNPSPNFQRRKLDLSASLSVRDCISKGRRQVKYNAVFNHRRRKRGGGRGGTPPPPSIILEGRQHTLYPPPPPPPPPPKKKKKKKNKNNNNPPTLSLNVYVKQKKLDHKCTNLI